MCDGFLPLGLRFLPKTNNLYELKDSSFFPFFPLLFSFFSSLTTNIYYLSFCGSGIQQQFSWELNDF